jgi:hypothetical protein
MEFSKSNRVQITSTLSIDSELLKIVIDEYNQHYDLNLGYTNKDAFVMRHINGMGYKEICSVMDINLAKLKRGIRIFRCNLMRSIDIESVIKIWERDKKLNILINV